MSDKVEIKILVVDGEFQCWWEGSNFYFIDVNHQKHVFENCYLSSLEFKGLECSSEETFIENNKVWKQTR